MSSLIDIIKQELPDGLPKEELDPEEEGEDISAKIIPLKSSNTYNRIYEKFKAWRASRQFNDYSENTLMAYFQDLKSFNIKSSTLWMQYSILKRVLSINHGVDVGSYNRVRQLLKKWNQGYEPKKCPVFTREQFFTFLTEAPDEKYLGVKVIIMIAVLGSCRREELVYLKTEEIQDCETLLYIKVKDYKTKLPRTFTIVGDNYRQIYLKYMTLRSRITRSSNRFFVKYLNGRCYNSPMGIKTIGGASRQMAKFLNLPRWSDYIWPCLKKIKINPI